METALLQNMVCALMGAVLGALLGAWITYIVEQNIRKKEVARALKHKISLLYWDLYSVEKYVQAEYASTRPGIRYSEHWQELLTPCSFLSDVQTSLIYQVYDLVYDFDYFFDKKFGNDLDGAQHTFHTLEVVFRSKEWKTILATLKERMDQKA